VWWVRIRRAPYAELHGALDGVRSELDRVRGELEGMRGHLEALKASTAGADQLSDVLQTTALLTESVESLTGDTAAAATELQKVAAEVRRVAAEVCDLQGVTGDEQRQLVSRLAELQQQLTAEQETREINRYEVSHVPLARVALCAPDCGKQKEPRSRGQLLYAARRPY
jgi:septal ring factor EnvC (AmiA/AmiB activator)